MAGNGRSSVRSGSTRSSLRNCRTPPTRDTRSGRKELRRVEHERPRRPTMPNVELVAHSDIDESHIAAKRKSLAAKGGRPPATYVDVRKLLEDKNIDAISIASPNHWHTLQTIWACQAGKDVYVEKPCSHNIFESRQIVAAARKYDRIVQMGSQSRSSSALKEGVQKMRDGEFGDIYMARA